MRLLLFIPLVLLASCGGNENTASTSPSPDENKAIKPDTNPLTADSLPPVSLKDTAKLDEYGRDSLKMSAQFQVAANKLSRAFIDKDVVTYASFTPPEIIKYYGGIQKYRSRVKELFDRDQTVFSRVVAGPVKRVQAAIDNEGYGHGWYCLMPVRRFLKTPSGETMEMQWLGGQTLDLGKTIYFLDITGKPREQVLQVMPDLRFVLDREAMP